MLRSQSCGVWACALCCSVNLTSLVHPSFLCVFSFFLFSLSQVVQDSWRELELYVSLSLRERLEQARAGYFPLTGSVTL